LQKILSIVVFSCLIYSCQSDKHERTNTLTEYYYPSISNFQNDTILTRIDLESISNYGELMNVTDRIACNGKLPVLQFVSNQNTINLLVFKDCSDSNSIVDYMNKNVISIEKNSIIINDRLEEPFDSLNSVLKKHILNPKSQDYYSTNIEKAIIFYNQDSLYPGQSIKNQFEKIVSEFNLLNSKNGDSLPLKIKLMDTPYIRHVNPPPPPKHIQIE
jgi:hypothetical protein